MPRRIAALALGAAALLALAAQPPGQPPTPVAAHGEVVKASRDALTVRPRSASGRFEKEMELHVTGTSRVSVLTVQERGGKPVFVQQEAQATDLKPGQAVAVIYAAGPGGPVLLTAVARPAEGR